MIALLSSGVFGQLTLPAGSASQVGGPTQRDVMVRSYIETQLSSLKASRLDSLGQVSFNKR